MGKVQSHMVEKVNQAFTEERKTQIKKSFLYCKERACVFKEVALLTRSSFQSECQISGHSVTSFFRILFAEPNII